MSIRVEGDLTPPEPLGSDGRTVVIWEGGGPEMRLKQLPHAIEAFVHESGKGEQRVTGLEWRLSPGADEFEIRVRLK